MRSMRPKKPRSHRGSRSSSATAGSSSQTMRAGLPPTLSSGCSTLAAGLRRERGTSHQAAARKARHCLPFWSCRTRWIPRGNGTVVIEAHGIAHRIAVHVDRLSEKPRLTHELTDSSVKNGTRITVEWPQSASTILVDRRRANFTTSLSVRLGQSASDPQLAAAGQRSRGLGKRLTRVGRNGERAIRHRRTGIGRKTLRGWSRPTFNTTKQLTGAALFVSFWRCSTGLPAPPGGAKSLLSSD